MNDLLAALLLGIIEGVTEFLPISSTGHLLIAEHWLGHRSDLFNIAIQAGAILAVVLIYRERLVQLLVGWAQRRHREYALKLALAFAVTAACGIVVKKMGFELPEEIAPIAWALLIGGFAILAIEAIDARRPDLADDDPNAIGWGTAVLVGLAQVLAGVFPGTSRSAAAIFAALLFGRSSRLAATEFAFLVGIPTMFAATGYEVLELSQEGGIAGEDWTALAVAFVASAITAFVSVKWLLGYIQTHRFTWFAWYRIVFGALLLVWLQVATAAPAVTVDAPVGTTTESALALRETSTPRGTAASFSAAARSTDVPADAARAREAADQAYEALKLCVDAVGARATMADPEGREWMDKFSRGEAEESADPAWRLRVADLMARQLEVYERSKTECIGVGKEATDGSIYGLAQRAAELGNRDAAACYVAMAWAMDRTHWEDARFRARYRENAPRFIDAGIAAGDWRMVGLGRVAAGKRHSDFEGDAGAKAAIWLNPTIQWLQAMDRNPQRELALLRLKSLGSADPAWAERFRRAGDDLARLLTTTEARAAAAWAEQTFQNAFKGRQDLENDAKDPLSCQ